MESSARVTPFHTSGLAARWENQKRCSDLLFDRQTGLGRKVYELHSDTHAGYAMSDFPPRIQFEIRIEEAAVQVQHRAHRKMLWSIDEHSLRAQVWGMDRHPFRGSLVYDREITPPLAACHLRGFGLLGLFL
jgi:hypothetical protein